MLDRIDYEECKPGDRITVMVGGQPYETVIDEHRTQRFIENPEHFLVKRLRNYSGGGNPNGDVADLNEMAIRYHRKEFSKRDYAEMNMAIGYSVSGFCDLSSFHDWDIDNPLWEAVEEPDPETAIEVSVTLTSAGREVLRAWLNDYKDDINQSCYGSQAARDEVTKVMETLVGEE